MKTHTPIFMVVAMVFAMCAYCQGTPTTQKTTLRTDHYDLSVEDNPLSAADIGKLCESLYATLRDFLQTEPHERLTVHVYANRDNYAAALNSRDVRDTSTAGMYQRLSKTVIVAAMWGPHATRAVILHECTHQFHFLARTHNRRPKSPYYAEGLAEYFAMHRPHGNVTLLATIPDIDLCDRPAEALRDFEGPRHRSFRLLAIDSSMTVSDSEQTAYGGAWGLVAFLISEHPAEYSKWASALDSMAEPVAAWDQALSRLTDEALTKEYRSWLLKHQEPWFVACVGDWENDGDESRAVAPNIGLTAGVVKRKVKFLSASVVVTSGFRDDAGVIIDYQSTSDYMTVEVEPNGEVVYAQLVANEWHEPVRTGVFVKDARRFDMTIVEVGGSAKIKIDGVEVLERKVREGTNIGLLAYYGGAVFSHLKVD